MLKKFLGRAEKQRYFDELSHVPGGTISPGGAAQLLRVSRQFVDALLLLDEINSWVFYEGVSSRASYIEISVRDLLRYGVRVGRINSSEDLILGIPFGKEEIEIINQNKS